MCYIQVVDKNRWVWTRGEKYREKKDHMKGSGFKTVVKRIHPQRVFANTASFLLPALTVWFERVVRFLKTGNRSPGYRTITIPMGWRTPKDL